MPVPRRESPPVELLLCRLAFVSLSFFLSLCHARINLFIIRFGAPPLINTPPLSIAWHWGSRSRWRSLTIIGLKHETRIRRRWKNFPLACVGQLIMRPTLGEAPLGNPPRKHPTKHSPQTSPPKTPLYYLISAWLGHASENGIFEAAISAQN